MKELICSITAKDCKFSYYRGSGPGGQKKNKTHSACRCVHILSSATGHCENYREQSLNKRIAFKRMAETEIFRNWLKLHVSEITGKQNEVEEKVKKQMNICNLRIEVKEEGKWTESNESICD